MHLVIDIGNTGTKVAFTENGRVVRSFRTDLPSEEISALADTFRPSSGIVSTVRDLSESEMDFIFGLGFPMSFLDAGTRLPLLLKYATPETLGPDRIAAAVGAWKKFPGRNVLIIDVGTAITYDVVTENAEYLGGNISPGKNLRFKALHDYTGRLPLVSADGDVPEIGYSTETAIRSGVLMGMADEIRGYVLRLSGEYKSLQVFFTGGDAKLFEKSIKNCIFADELLVLEGLDVICEFNEK